MDLGTECKKCMVCSQIKPIRKECDPVKTRHSEQIHEYNYSCYKCLVSLEQKKMNNLIKHLL